MKQVVRWIIDFIISCLKDLIAKTKIDKMEKEVKDAKRKAKQDVENADKSYDEFMSYYSDYQSDLKRRGMSTLRGSTGELRGSGEETKESIGKPKKSNKKTR